MNDPKNDFRDLFAKMRFDDAPDPRHRDALEQRLLTALSEAPRPTSAHAEIWRAIMKSETTRFAVAAVIAVAFLVPLSYGTSRLIQRLTAPSYGCDECKGTFQLGNDTQIKLHSGTKEQPEIVSAESIRFFVEDEQIRGTLRFISPPWPKYQWRTRIELLDAAGNRRLSTEHVTANAGIELPDQGRLYRCMHFSLGSATRVSEVASFRINLERASPKDAITPDAWVESKELSVVHGRVTDANGRPIVGAIAEIRQERLPGMAGIDAPDTLTDGQGYYCFDDIKWRYTVAALIYQDVSPGRASRHHVKAPSEVWEGSQTVNFQFDPFPAGTAILTGTAIDASGNTLKKFTVDVRVKVDWTERPTKQIYQYGIKESFDSPDGSFKIGNLPAGTFDIYIAPVREPRADIPYTPGQRYFCDLRDGQETRIGTQNAEGKTWYGRVQFEDGTPAILDSPTFSTQVKVTRSTPAPGGRVMGRADATVDKDGYFAIRISNERGKQIESGELAMTISIARTNSFNGTQTETRFPFELLSLDRDKAGSVTIARPQAYFGRILYENGKPAFPPAPPWPGAKVRVRLQYTQANPAAEGMTELSGLDEQGYFIAYLTDGQLKAIKEGLARLDIVHPSYEWERESYVIGQFPIERLSSERNNVGQCVLSFAQMPSAFKDLRQYVDSASRVQELLTALTGYRNAHRGSYPPAFEQLSVSKDDLSRLSEGIEYVPPVPSTPAPDPADTVLAYDKALLKTAKGTHVLFRDGHIEYCQPRRLRALGIREPDESTSH